MVHNALATSIEQHLGTPETGGVRVVASLDLLGVPAVEQRVLLCMDAYAKIGPRRSTCTSTRGIYAMRHTTWYTIVATANYATMAVSQHAPNRKLNASRPTRKA